MQRCFIAARDDERSRPRALADFALAMAGRKTEGIRLITRMMEWPDSVRSEDDPIFANVVPVSVLELFEEQLGPQLRTWDANRAQAAPRLS